MMGLALTIPLAPGRARRMRPTRSLAQFAALAILASGLTGCGGCEGPPPPAPPPVQGVVPAPPAPAAAQGTPLPDQHVCAVLVFTNVDGGEAPLQAELTAEGDCTKGTARVEWNFGDGSPPATGTSLVHTFEKPGTYKVVGKITSDELPGLEDNDDVEIVVTAPKG